MKTFMNNSKQILFAAVAAVSLASVAVSAHADQTVAVVPTRTVHFADLNLNTQAGADALYNRIRSAAQQVCGATDTHRRLEEVAAEKACVGEAIASSVNAVNNANLTIAYNARMGHASKQINLASVR